MEVKNCRNCGRLFNYMGGGYLICPNCMAEVEAKFKNVKQYILDNPHATIHDIAEDNDVTSQQIERWIREERLVFGDDSPVGIECENCGASIKTGRFCAKCKDSMKNNLNSMYKKDEPKPVDRRQQERDRARMRFLDN